ncbi:AMP-activated serine/threonine-protein kinase regulatory subunit [Tulasnella sp. 419]|nr:AMP-activated serine/threonine-protein kinase regulatory subunit [Tulasnella sp. 418]KAG8970402.1 AMP-activated serine/threonine-protein kinase regulatory subunit [Tulasnella sp. 419]
MSGAIPSPRPNRKVSTKRRGRALSSLPPPQSEDTHNAALASIRTFLKGRSSYDVFPVSFRLIVLDTKLEVKKALGALMTAGVVSAPLWDGEQSCFAGMFTVSDIIHLIQYYYVTSTYDNAAADVEQFRLESLREIERALSVPPPPLLYIHPLRPLLDACQLLNQSHARRLPLLDRDQQTGDEVVLSVLTQYRVLKFIAINCREISHLHLPLRALGIGTYVDPSPDHPNEPYYPIKTATLDTTVFDVVHMFSGFGISAVPIIDEQGVVVNLYETVDVITLVRLGAYQSLDLTIEAALAQRSPDFPGVVTCSPYDSLASLMLLIKQRRVHRLVVVEGDEPKAGARGRERDWNRSGDLLRRGESTSRVRSSTETTGGEYTPERSTSNSSSDPSPPVNKVKGRLLGIITLSDVLQYIVGQCSIISGGIEEGSWGEDEEGMEARRQSEEGVAEPGAGGLGIDLGSFGLRGESRVGSEQTTRESTNALNSPSLSTPNNEQDVNGKTPS